MREAVTPVWHPAPTLADSTPRNSPSPFAGRRRCGHCRRPGASTDVLSLGPRPAQSGNQAGSVQNPGRPGRAGPPRGAARRGTRTLACHQALPGRLSQPIMIGAGGLSSESRAPAPMDPTTAALESAPPRRDGRARGLGSRRPLAAAQGHAGRAPRAEPSGPGGFEGDPRRAVAGVPPATVRAGAAAEPKPPQRQAHG